MKGLAVYALLLMSWAVTTYSVNTYAANTDAQEQNDWYRSLQPFLNVTSFTYSENMPIDAFDNDFEGSWPDDGQYEFTHNKYRIGFAYRDVDFSYFKRQDYFFRTVGDTFNLIYRDQNDIEFPTGEVFDIYLHVQKVELSGFTLGHRFSPILGLEIYLAGSYFESNDVLYGSVEGELWQDESRPKGDLVLDYIYTEDHLLDRPLTAPASGYGWGVDFALSWQFSSEIVFEANIEDLAARINWKHAPHSSAVLVSERNRINEQGEAFRVPTLSARHGFRDRTQKLPTHNSFRASYTLKEKYIFKAERETYDRVNFSRVFIAYTHVSWFKAELGYDFKSQAKSIELWTPHVSLLVASDRLDLKKSKNIRFEFSLAYTF